MRTQKVYQFLIGLAIGGILLVMLSLMQKIFYDHIKQKDLHNTNLERWIFCITPTFSRYAQKAELVRLSQTLMHVKHLHWIVVEDSDEKTKLVKSLLVQSGLHFTHLNIPTSRNLNKNHHRGVEQRNLGLEWIRNKVKPNEISGVVYFMDDDNTYHLKLFEQMRNINHVGVWPVGIVGGVLFERPICSMGKVTGFQVEYAKYRAFPVDMAGFAVNLKVLVQDNPYVLFQLTSSRGSLASTFLQHITTISQLEGLGRNCTEVLVWHTSTQPANVSLENEKLRRGEPSDLTIET